MGKFLRFIGILIIVLVLIVVILGLIEPKDISVERTVMIKAPKDMVFDQMVKFKNWVNWDPWYKADSTMKIDYMGNDGAPGSSYHWMSKKAGEGSIENIAVKDGQLDFSMHMIKPWKQNSDGILKAEDAGNGQTKASWGFTSHFSFPWNSMLAFMNMDKMLDSDFDRGLQYLKDYTEKMPAGMSSLSIRDTIFPAHTYMGIRKKMSWNEMQKFFADSYSQTGKAAGSVINGSAVGVFYMWDTANHMADIFAAFPVSDTSKPLNGASCAYIPQSKAYMITHKGGYMSIGNEHMTLQRYIAAKGKRANMVIEEYAIGPYQDKDSTKWVTNIYYLVQ
ncbi:MAG TPA: SRPBCC family protein [Flavipsychrobacter sp.]|nr:SRPBCC family protein [Flavipsychrobacter sp.]